MSGGSSQQTTTNENQSSQTQPWTPAQPMLMNVLNQLGLGNLGATPGQQQAIQNIQGTANNLPQFGPQGAQAVENALGMNTQPQQQGIQNSIGALQPYLNSDYLNPMTNPYTGQAISTMNQDITQQIEGQNAAAGRPIGSNADASQALARGLSQGEGGLLMGQYNTNVGQQQAAINAIPGMEGQITAQQLAPLQEAQSGLQTAAGLPGLYMGSQIPQLSAAGLEASEPYMNVQNIEGMTLPIAGLGAESQGTMSGVSTTQQNTSPFSNILGGALGGLGLLGGTGAFGSAGWLSSMLPMLMLSDERAKEDIEQVGELKDETPVYSFKYKGDPTRTTRIGLLAQDVEQYEPSAVVKIGGVKHVDYRKATERARHVGMLDMAA